MLASILKGRDVFGHHVKFTINGGNGTEQTSKLGGAVSLIIYAFIATYVGLKLQKIFQGNLDNITNMEQMADYNSLGKIYMHGLMPYISIVSLGTEILQYLEV